MRFLMYDPPAINRMYKQNNQVRIPEATCIVNIRVNVSPGHGRTMETFSGMMDVETDWSRVPALSRRDVGFDDSPGSFSGAGVAIFQSTIPGFKEPIHYEISFSPRRLESIFPHLPHSAFCPSLF